MIFEETINSGCTLPLAQCQLGKASVRLPSCQGQASVDSGWMDILLFYYYYYLCPNLSHCVSHTEPEGMQFHSPVHSLLHGLKDNKMLFD